VEKQLAHRIQTSLNTLDTKNRSAEADQRRFQSTGRETKEDERTKNKMNNDGFYLPLPRFGLAGAKPHPNSSSTTKNRSAEKQNSADLNQHEQRQKRTNALK
jgi:hypothetical protein